jgi:flagellar motor switch protein FliG
VIVLVAIMRGLRSGSDIMSPELTITSRPTRSEANGDTEMQKSRMTSPHTQGTLSEHVDTHSSSSREAFTARDGLAKSESETASEQEADPLAAFDHLGWLDAESIQKLYRCLPDEPWALALSGASTQIQEHVLKSLSRSTSMMLQKRMDSLPAIRLRDVEDAQRRLAEWVRKLDETADVG